MTTKSKKPAANNSTTPRQFRLDSGTLADLDAVAATHALGSRAAAIRFLARKEARNIFEKSQKNA